MDESISILEMRILRSYSNIRYEDRILPINIVHSIFIIEDPLKYSRDLCLIPLILKSEFKLFLKKILFFKSLPLLPLSDLNS